MLDVLLSGSALELEEFFREPRIDQPEVGPARVRHHPDLHTTHRHLRTGHHRGQQSIALYTTLVLGPWLGAMWRARRRLADATAVQLTRNPTALARAPSERLRRCDVEVAGGWAVNFLFPVWPPITEEIVARETDMATFIVGMRLDPADRLERLAALGALVEAGPPGPPRDASPAFAVPCPTEGAGLGDRLGTVGDRERDRPDRRDARRGVAAPHGAVVRAPVGYGTSELGQGARAGRVTSWNGHQRDSRGPPEGIELLTRGFSGDRSGATGPGPRAICGLQTDQSTAEVHQRRGRPIDFGPHFTVLPFGGCACTLSVACYAPVRIGRVCCTSRRLVPSP